MPNISSIIRIHLLRWVACCVAVTVTAQCFGAAVDANTGGSEWRWSPYSVGLCLVVDDSLGRDGMIERETTTALLRWQSNWLNGICDFQQEIPPDAIRQALTRDQNLASLLFGGDDTGAVDKMPPTFPSSWERHDKLVFIVVRTPEVRANRFSPDGAARFGWSATVRELDVRTRMFGEIRQVDTAQQSQLPELLFEGIAESLTPLARIVRVDEANVMLEERAGELLALQENLPSATRHKVLIPVTRTNDRDGNPLLIRRVDWTFLSVERNSGGLLSTTMHTGLRSPINARMRPRHQQLALLAKPTDDHTTIHFASYVSQEMPLPICDILEAVPGRKQAVNIGTTSPWGEFRIDYLPERPVRLLYVRNGANLIARIPVLPGVDRVLTAEVPIADSTLHAESLVLGLQEEILDTLATRQIFVAQAITYRQRSDRKAFDDTLQKLRRLKTRQNYESELNILKMQLPYDDSVSRRRIETMIEQTRRLVRESLPPVEVPWSTK